MMSRFVTKPLRVWPDGTSAQKGDARDIAGGFTIAMPGDSDPASIAPGDVLLVRNTLVFSRGVQSLQRLRYGPFAWPSHAALVDSTSGDLIEAGRDGVIRTDTLSYQHLYRAYLHPSLLCGALDPHRALQFARDCADHHLSIARRFFLLNAIALLTEIQTPIRPRAVPTCSGFVANALQAGGFLLDKNPLYITPADLAARFGVRDPRLSHERLRFDLRSDSPPGEQPSPTRPTAANA